MSPVIYYILIYFNLFKDVSENYFILFYSVHFIILSMQIIMILIHFNSVYSENLKNQMKFI